MVTEKYEPEKVETCQVLGCTYSDKREKLIQHLVEVHGFDEPGARALYISHVVAAAEKAGATPVPSRFGKTKTFGDVMGDRKIIFFPELPRKEWGEMLNETFIIESCKIVSDFSGKFGKSSFPLFKILMEDGIRYTTLGSGKAILNQAQMMNDKRLWPVQTKLVFITPADGGDPYYSFA